MIAQAAEDAGDHSPSVAPASLALAKRECPSALSVVLPECQFLLPADISALRPNPRRTTSTNVAWSRSSPPRCASWSKSPAPLCRAANLPAVVVPTGTPPQRSPDLSPRVCSHSRNASLRSAKPRHLKTSTVRCSRCEHLTGLPCKRRNTRTLAVRRLSLSRASSPRASGYAVTAPRGSLGGHPPRERPLERRVGCWSAPVPAGGTLTRGRASDRATTGGARAVCGAGAHSPGRGHCFATSRSAGGNGGASDQLEAVTRALGRPARRHAIRR